MDLDTVLAKHTCFKKADAEDNQILVTEIKNSPMQFSSFKMIYDRSPSFFRLLQLQAESSVTLISKAANKILALASFSWGPRWINGQKKIAMYVGDFRCENSRTLAKAWRALYPDLIHFFKTSSEYGPIAFLYTAVLKDNAHAINSLVKNKSGKTFFYKLFAEVTMVNVFFKRPFSAKKKMNVKSADTVGEEQLRDFLSKTHSQMFLGSCFDNIEGNEWDRRQRLWPGFSLENFLVLTDSDNQITACTLPWSPADAKQMRLISAGTFISLALTLALVCGFKLPSVGTNIKTLYLTHLTVDPIYSLEERAAFVSAFLDFILSQPKFSSFHFITFADFKSIRLLAPLKNYVTQTTCVNLYAVDTNNEAIVLPAGCEIEFEMGLV